MSTALTTTSKTNIASIMNKKEASEDEIKAVIDFVFDTMKTFGFKKKL